MSERETAPVTMRAALNRDRRAAITKCYSLMQVKHNYVMFFHLEFRNNPEFMSREVRRLFLEYILNMTDS